MEPNTHRSFLRGVDKTGGHVSERFDSLSGFFAETVMGKYNQDISFLLVGKKGSGKSYTSLSLAYNCALKLADALGGPWTKYFNIENNLATIDPVKANEVMGNLGEHQVKVLDDIGIGWGARNWQDEENKAKNDCVQISRISKQIVIYSCPSQFLLDKIPRSLVSHYGETSQQFFSKGFVTIKVFEPQILHRQGKIIQPYLLVNKNKFVLYQITSPPKELSNAYDTIRKEVTLRISKERMDTIMNCNAGEKVDKRMVALQEDLTKYGDQIKDMKDEGMTPTAMSRKLGLSREKVNRLMGHV